MNFWHPSNDMPGYRFHVNYSIEHQAREIRVGYVDYQGKHSYGEPVVFTEREFGSPFPPTLRIRDKDGDSLQHLFNAMWDAGYRPRKEEIINVDSVVAAKDENLRDLRQILEKVM
jgi:hypothetical protein